MNGILYPIVSKVACLTVEAFSWYIKIAVQSRLFIGNYISFFFNPKIFVLIKPSIFFIAQNTSTICSSECSSYERQSFQLCSTAEQDCLERELRSVNDYANEICTKYKLRYPSLLSGRGKQLAPRKGKLESRVFSFSNLKFRISNELK